MSEELTETAPQQSNRRTMIIGGVSAVLLGCCALLVVAALVIVVDPFGLNIFARLTGQYDAAATAMPADTVLYAGVNLLNLDAQEIGRIAQPFLEAAGDPQVDNLDGAQSEFRETIESEFGINIESDVVPWIGQYVGFGITDILFDNFGEVDSVTWIVAVESRNGNAADEFLVKLRDALADSSGSNITEQSYEGVNLYVMQGSDPVEQITFGRSDNLVILGANVIAVQAAIDAQNGDSLDESEGYRQIIGDLPGSRALTVYSTGAGTRDLISQIDSLTAVPVNPSGLPLTSFASFATTVSIVEAGLQIDMVSYFDQEQLSSTQQALLEAGGQESETAGLFPGQTIAFANGQRLDLLWLTIRESTGDEIGFDESMDSFAQEFGLNPGTDLFPLLNGEWAVGIIAGQSGLMSEELDIPLGFTLVAGTDQPDEMAGTVQALRAGLEGQLLIVNEAETNGLVSYQVSLAENASPAFNFGLEQDYFFISSSENAAVETFSGEAALAENEQYQAVSAEFARGVNLAFYLNVRALLGTLRESRTGFDLLDFNDSIRVIEPIEAIALGNAYDNDVRRTQIIILIETE